MKAVNIRRDNWPRERPGALLAEGITRAKALRPPVRVKRAGRPAGECIQEQRKTWSEGFTQSGSPRSSLESQLLCSEDLPLYRRGCYLKSTKHLVSLSPHTVPCGFWGWPLASHSLGQAGLVSAAFHSPSCIWGWVGLGPEASPDSNWTPPVPAGAPHRRCRELAALAGATVTLFQTPGEHWWKTASSFFLFFLLLCFSQIGHPWPWLESRKVHTTQNHLKKYT